MGGESGERGGESGKRGGESGDYIMKWSGLLFVNEQQGYRSHMGSPSPWGFT